MSDLLVIEFATEAKAGEILCAPVPRLCPGNARSRIPGLEYATLGAKIESRLALLRENVAHETSLA